MEIYLIRHTLPQIAEGVCYGITNLPLAKGYEQLFMDVKKELSMPENTVVYTSSLARCLLLAEFLSDKKCIIDSRLVEIDFGKWELQPWSDLPRAEFDNWSSDFVNNPTPGGQCFVDIYEKVVAFYYELLATGHEVVAVVSHAGVIRALLTHLLSMPLSHAFRLDISYGGITKLNVNEHVARVEYINKIVKEGS